MSSSTLLHAIYHKEKKINKNKSFIKPPVKKPHPTVYTTEWGSTTQVCCVSAMCVCNRHWHLFKESERLVQCPLRTHITDTIYLSVIAKHQRCSKRKAKSSTDGFNTAPYTAKVYLHVTPIADAT